MNNLARIVCEIVKYIIKMPQMSTPFFLHTVAQVPQALEEKGCGGGLFCHRAERKSMFGESVEM